MLAKCAGAEAPEGWGRGQRLWEGGMAAAVVSPSGHAQPSVAGLPAGLSIHCSLVCDNTEFCIDAVHAPGRYVIPEAAQLVQGTSPKNMEDNGL